MHPQNFLLPPNHNFRVVGPYWSEPSPSHVWSWRVYLSDQTLLDNDNAAASSTHGEDEEGNNIRGLANRSLFRPNASAVQQLVENKNNNSILLFKSSSSLSPSDNVSESRSFILTNDTNHQNDTVLQEWYQQLLQKTRKHQDDDDDLSKSNPRSVVYFVLEFVRQRCMALYSFVSSWWFPSPDTPDTDTSIPELIWIPPLLWQRLQQPDPLYLHVLLIRGKDPSEDYTHPRQEEGRLMVLYMAHEAIVGSICLMRHSHTFKSHLGIRVVNETDPFPLVGMLDDYMYDDQDQYDQYVSLLLGMPLVPTNPKQSNGGERTSAYLPVLVPEPLGITTYEAVAGLANEYDFRLDPNVAAVPLHVELGGAVPPPGWRLYSLLQRQQQEEGFVEERDKSQDKPADVFYVLARWSFHDVVIAGILFQGFVVFHFLALRLDLQFWNTCTDWTGLNVGAPLVHVLHLGLSLLLFENDDQGGPLTAAWTLAVWKCQRIWEFRLVPRVDCWWSWWILIVGGWEMLIFVVACGFVQLKSQRMPHVSLFSSASASSVGAPHGTTPKNGKKDSVCFTLEMDQRATRMVCKELFPMVLLYRLYRMYHNDDGENNNSDGGLDLFYFWLSLVSDAVFDLHLLMVIPQLVLNHAFRSVSRLPWKSVTCHMLQFLFLDLVLEWTRFGLGALRGVHHLEYLTFLSLGGQACWYFLVPRRDKVKQD